MTNLRDQLLTQADFLKRSDIPSFNDFQFLQDFSENFYLKKVILSKDDF